MTQQVTERVLCLYRVSSSRQVDYSSGERADIPMQKKACREFAHKMGWPIIFEEQEAGVSGYKVSASARSNHVDHLVNYIRYWISEGESQKISMRTRTRLAQLVEEGHSKGGTAPYGYQYEDDIRMNRHGYPLKKLVIHEPEAETVRMIYDRYTNYGYGPQRISTYLREQHITSRSGSNWHPASIRAILRNLTYIGVLRCGDARSEPIPDLCIIDNASFLTAQRINEERRDPGIACQNSRSSCHTLLSGNIFCGHCGSRLVSTSNVKRYTKKNGEISIWKKYRYTCYGKIRKQTNCDGQTGYGAKTIDEIVTILIHEMLANLSAPCSDHTAIERKQQRIKALRMERRQLNNELKAIAVSIKILEQEYSSLYGAIVNAQLKPLSDAITRTISQKVGITKRLAIVKGELTRAETILTQLLDRQVAETISWSELYEAADAETKRLISSCLVNRVAICSGTDVYIELAMELG